MSAIISNGYQPPSAFHCRKGCAPGALHWHDSHGHRTEFPATVCRCGERFGETRYVLERVS